MGRKKRKQTNQLPQFLLTHELIGIIEKALTVFEEPLGRANPHNAKTMLAKEITHLLKEKLAVMKQSDRVCATTFDYNEGVVIVAAMQLYVLDLSLLPQNAQRIKERQQCKRIAAYFARETASRGRSR